MKLEDYWEKVKTNRINLEDFLWCYHPASRNFNPKNNMEITAPLAESACNVIREKIKKENTLSPVTRFNQAIAAQDINEIYNLLQSAWFGVPESTDCWGITGFTEAVELLEDPPDELMGEN